MRRAGILAVVALALSVAPFASAAAPPGPPPIDSDTQAKNTTDAVFILRWLGNGRYQLEGQNTRGIGFINSFDWVPPPGLSIRSVDGTVGGKCKLVTGNISCTGKLKPPRCTCLPGGEMTISFSATGGGPGEEKGIDVYHGSIGSYLAIKTVTPVPYHIPSSLS